VNWQMRRAIKEKRTKQAKAAEAETARIVIAKTAGKKRKTETGKDLKVRRKRGGAN
jgi:hypothetical protein